MKQSQPKEFKVKYSHRKATPIIEKLGARFYRREVLKDFYLVNGSKDIYKFSMVGKEIKLVHLVSSGSGFDVEFARSVDLKTQKALSLLFGKNRGAMVKDRSRYRWKKSEIVLDTIAGLGEFIELYPVNEKDKNLLFDALGIKSSNLITRNYFLLKQNRDSLK